MSRDREVTLCYITCGGRVLLIRKKRGLGAGRINGPGGKVDAGETPLEAAVRETREETGLTPVDPQLRGDLLFHFVGGSTHRCLIYLSRAFTGEACETPEAVPIWFSRDALPFDEMWADDREWLPWLLDGHRFTGWAKVDGESVVEQHFEIVDGHR